MEVNPGPKSRLQEVIQEVVGGLPVVLQVLSKQYLAVYLEKLTDEDVLFMINRVLDLCQYVVEGAEDEVLCETK